MSARPRLMLAAAAVFVAAGATTAQAAVQSRTIAVPDLESRTVEVQFLREDGARGASYVFVARNRTAERRLIRARYVSAHDHAFVITGEAQTTRGARPPSTDLTSPRGLAISVPPHEVATFTVAYDAAATSATPEQADGRLILTSERPRRHRVVGAPLVLRLSGVRAEERDVQVTPSDVTLPLTLATPHLHATKTLRDILDIEARDKDARAYVELRGPGAAALAGSSKTIKTVLRRDDGKSVRVTLRVRSVGDNVARLVMPFGDVEIDEPGRYTGTLPVGPGAQAPSVTLNVDAKLWIGWAVIVVVIGVFLGRMVPPFLRRERRKRRGRDAIADAIRIYGSNRRGRAEAASYDLDWLIAPARWQVRGVFSRPHDLPARLLRELNEESDETAINDAVDKARALRARVERWAQVEEAARRLQDELASHGARRQRLPEDEAYLRSRRRPPSRMPVGDALASLAAVAAAVVLIAWRPHLGVIGWLIAIGLIAVVSAVVLEGTISRRRERHTRELPDLIRNDAHRVLNALSKLDESARSATETESADDGTKVDKVVEACVRADRERRVVHLALEVWRRNERLDGRRMRLDDAMKRYDELELEAIWPHAATGLDVPVKAESRKLVEFKRLSRELGHASHDLKMLQRQYPPFGTPSTALAGTVLDRVPAYGLWVIEALWRTAVRTVEVVVRSVLGVLVGIVRWVIGTGRGWIAVASVLTGLLTLCVPVLVYVLTLYTATWGSPLDVLTAFAAGFGGKIALDFGSTLRMPSLPSQKPAVSDETEGGVTQVPPPPEPPQNGDTPSPAPAVSS